MDKTSIIGIILALIALSVGMVLKGVSLSALANPAAILIILFGTISAVIIAFPGKEIKKVPALFKVLFKENKQLTIAQLIPMFSQWAQIARREGLLALEASIEDVDDAFLKNGLSMAVDGQSAEFIRDIMTEEVEAMEDRHQAGAAIFTQAGTYAPTLGVLGAVIGLIAALSNMNNTEALGHAISAAFVATLLGIFTGYVLWHPFANKLKRKSKQEVKLREIMIEGVLSVLEGQAPKVIEQKLLMYLPANERAKVAEQEGETNNGEKKEEEA
ncbi:MULTISPECIES: flagellar motor stator protein MotA [Bacillus]|uniref:flagellar motor stator protein MotA n=1 Tax=Bacillus TaxID=1386 RepID=UPI00025B2843|nr:MULTISPECIES: flagellar motor stator protein MotA [Bacillus]MBL3613103.1 flagellar motor stator protein MotA [Bacillus sp. RHFS18]ATX83858.1 flagellar motor stator protein MotA [Bacillus velezensis]AVM08937.1 flagellar motor protein MotA [Bacillus velezensis]EIF12913.1 flagellar motor protein MotA [Bacillus sp. 5B6]KAF6550084.1 flagellar motor stator protein MotA [Bacillus sp. EKM206B]